MTSKLAMTPLSPQESALQQHGIFDLVTQLDRQAAKLTGMIPTQSADTIRCHMAVINFYYSNLIEGKRTLHHEIREAQCGHYSDDPVKRDHQIESVAHIRVQKWIQGQELTLKTVCSTAFILTLHRRFYEGLPESLRQLRDENEIVAMVEPGQWRQQNVKVGRHVPPDAKGLASLMEGFCDEYRSARYPGYSRLIGLACAHHRFLWIHPFMDGNGRVVRLWTDALFRAEGLESYGIWSLSRGLARQSSDYKAALAQADYPMQGTNDGRVPGMTRKYRPITVLLLYNAFLAGSLERADAIDLTGMPKRSAIRLLAQLKKEGLLSETSSRSPLKWDIPEYAEPFYFPQLAPGA
jgi:Fic family protein